MAEPIWLDVPSHDEEAAKAAGAQWDPKQRHWFAPGPQMSALDRWRPATAAAGTPILRSLSPAYVPDQHQNYVEILKAELTKSGLDAPRNIALTGHYGSGKSSVLVETQRALGEHGVKVINLSLPSLGIGDGRIRENGDKALDTTNLIQKEIVKQLLYRRKPSDMPASRYSRLDTFHWGRALGPAVCVGLAATAFALLARVPDKFRDALPAGAWAWIDGRGLGKPAALIQWLSLLVVFVLTGLAALWVQRLLQQRIRVTELAAGPTKVTLSDSSSSYFDEYLDEIVYFFQTSKTAVVIFEDLDRFKDPHIFETLRELNMLLNNAEQTGEAPIRFVYAIRDSIFEQLDGEADDDEVDAPSTDQGETRRLMSTNRTKFFDLVVPMVPFISHRTSRDLIRRELEVVPLEQRPGNAVVDVVGAHLTDMRLIKNICNEYEVFRRRILTDGGLKELTADRLFASIVYKNLYLADYEKIRNGTSLLDALYRAYRDWATQQTAAARKTERDARSRSHRIDAIESRGAGLGLRLQHVLRAMYGHINSNTVLITYAGINYSWTQLATGDFWRAYLQKQGDLLIHHSPGYAPSPLSFDNVQLLMARSLAPDDWTDEAKAQINKEIIKAGADQRFVQHASMADALKEPERLFSYRGTDRSFSDVAAELFEGADLVLELQREGLIDENFTLYITQFPGQAISSSAMNFIIKAVQPDVMDIEYHFSTGEDLDTDVIKAVLDAEPLRLLGGQSVYNIEIFDYLLTKDPCRLDDPIRRLAARAGSDRDFLDAYVTSGAAAPTLVHRLSGVWPGIFEYLIGQDPEARGEELLDAALSGMRPELTYSTNATQRSVLSAALSNFSTIREPQSAERAVEIAETVLRMDIHVNDLGAAAEPLRTELAKRSVYPVTLTNLKAVLGDQANLSLDSIKTARELDVYPHVCAHMQDYLGALDEGTNIPTVADPALFADVLSDVGEAADGKLEEVARKASSDCILSDLESPRRVRTPMGLRVQRVAGLCFERSRPARVPPAGCPRCARIGGGG